MVLMQKDVDRAIRDFAELNENRQLYEREQHLKRRKDRENIQLHPFKPFVHEDNNLLAQRSRSRQQMRRQLEDRLMNKENEPTCADKSE